mmetsp:Transcript_69195/g.123194  ORF Transcript_69195/g.123194 Transcript_69195/m.123194 type:complete len:93 (+) Transcript_69195:757-1035(+)
MADDPKALFNLDHNGPCFAMLITADNSSLSSSFADACGDDRLEIDDDERLRLPLESQLTHADDGRLSVTRNNDNKFNRLSVGSCLVESKPTM